MLDESEPAGPTMSEPNPLSSPPRTVKLREGTPGPFRAWLFFAAMGIGSAALTLAMAHQLIVQFAGTETTGKVIGTRVTNNRTAGKPNDATPTKSTYRVHYEFELEGGTRQRWAKVSRYVFKDVENGQQIAVRYWTPTHGLGAIPRFPGHFSMPPFGLVAAAGVSWLLAGMGFYAASVKPAREKRLVASGIAVPTTITQRTTSKDGKTHQLHYQFTVPSNEVAEGEQLIANVQTVKPEIHERLSEGSVATVLYLPGQPQKAQLYDTLGYEAAS